MCPTKVNRAPCTLKQKDTLVSHNITKEAWLQGSNTMMDKKAAQTVYGERAEQHAQ